MGKGTIISHIADGEYNVTVVYNRDDIAAAIAILTTREGLLIDAIAAETDDLKKSLLRLQLVSVQKRLEYLADTNHVPEDDNITAWCADLTTDLSGDVGLIEIGREQTNGVNIQPGYEGNAVFDSTRDGQLTPLMAQDPAATFYNLAMLPGTQKWKPTYLYGEITAIDYDLKTCSVTLDAISSSQQALSIINGAYGINDVPIDYMDCDAIAFVVGDRALVKFEGYSWDAPKVIGFEEEPKTCDIIVLLIRLDTEYILWDVARNALFPLLDSEGVETQPLSLSAMNAKLTDLGLAKISDLAGCVCQYFTMPGDGAASDSNGFIAMDFPGYPGGEEECVSHETYTCGSIELVVCSHFSTTSDDGYADMVGTFSECDISWVWDKYVQKSASGAGALVLNDTGDSIPWYRDRDGLYDATMIPGGGDWIFLSADIDSNISEKSPPGTIYGSQLSLENENKRPCFFITELVARRYYIGSGAPYVSPPYIFSASKTVSYKSCIQDVEYSDVVTKTGVNYTEDGDAHTVPPCTIDVPQYPAKSGMYQTVSVVLEQPIAIDPDDGSNRWGLSILYVGVGTPIDPEDPSAGYTYSWDDLAPVDMEAVYSNFSKTFDADMVARGIGAGLVVSIYSRS